MTAAVMIMYTNAPAEQAEAFKRWYHETHIPDICTIPGVVSGRVYELAGPGVEQIARDGKPTVARFMAIYELEHGDEAVISAAIQERAPQFKAAGRSFEGIQPVSRAIYRAA